MNRANATTIAQRAIENGMRTLRTDGWTKVKAGLDDATKLLLSSTLQTIPLPSPVTWLTFPSKSPAPTGRTTPQGMIVFIRLTHIDTRSSVYGADRSRESGPAWCRPPEWQESMTSVRFTVDESREPARSAKSRSVM